jgi:hypothetical protein
MALWRGWMDDPGDEWEPFQEPGAPPPLERDYGDYVFVGQRLLRIRRRNQRAMWPTWSSMLERWRHPWRQGK